MRTKLSNGLTVTAALPPKTFDPRTASQQELLAFGYPLRPDKSPELLARWKSLIGAPLKPILPEFKEITNVRHRPRMRALANAAGTSTNWSGGVIQHRSPGIVSSVGGKWVVPTPSAPTKDGKRYYSSSWIGIDGDGSADVFQAGAECEAVYSNGSQQQTIYAWWEWFPAGEMQITNFPVTAGDTLSCLMTVSPQYGVRILETGTTFAPENDGVWLMADYDRDGIPDLVYIKTKNTGTGKVEVHIASGASNYQTRILEVGTTFDPEDDGVWFMADYDRDGIPDLVFIKTKNTGTGTVEVHIASGASHYQTRILETGTTFGEEDDGVWLMADYDRDGIPDLIFIKTANTGTGSVEVHVASGASNYQTRILETGTTFGLENDGTWLMADYDRDGIPDLVFIKTSNTGTGTVEVHVASGASHYQTRVLETGTTFLPENDGTWLLTDYDRDRVPDLIFVKTSNTGTGKVETHVARAQGSLSSGSVVLRNETKGTSTSFQFSAPTGTALVGNCAEWVVERPEVGGAIASLASYGTVTFGNASAATTVGQILDPKDGDTLDMVDGATTISKTTVDNKTVVCKYTGP